MVVGYYYGSSVQAVLYRPQNCMLTNDEWFFEGTREPFQIWVIQFHEKVGDSESVDHDMWIVSVPFGAMRYINDGRNLLKTGLRSWSVWGMRENNVEFYEIRSPDGPAYFQTHLILAIPGLQNLDVAKGLYCD